MSINVGRKALVRAQDRSMVPKNTVPRSQFIDNFSRKQTFNASELNIILWDELLPGDHVKYDISAFGRMATPVFPIMDGQRLDIHIWFDASRNLWTNWEKLKGAQFNVGDTIAYTVPQIVSPAGGFAANTIYDDMEIPVLGQITGGETITINALPFRMYNRIYNRNYRDENLMAAKVENTGNGPDLYTDYVKGVRAKPHDYFTDALPTTQKGNPVYAALTGTLSVQGLGTKVNTIADGTNYREALGTVNYANAVAVPGLVARANAAGAAGYPDVYVTLGSGSQGLLINDLRQAMLVQQLLEKSNRGGTRYWEILENEFGVHAPDRSLSNPEYIGGGSMQIGITPVPQTAPAAGGSTPLGAVGAAGTFMGRATASFAAPEYGYVLAIMSVRTEISYQQGLHRAFSRLSRYDFYTASLDGLGEQPILRQELYCTGTDALDNTVFGYKPAWEEMRRKQSSVVGLFRSTTAGTIDPWHLAEKFTSAPVLNSSFIQDTALLAIMTRVLVGGAAENWKQYIGEFTTRRTITRPMSSYGVPANLGRF